MESPPSQPRKNSTPTPPTTTTTTPTPTSTPVPTPTPVVTTSLAPPTLGAGRSVSPHKSTAAASTTSATANGHLKAAPQSSRTQHQLVPPQQPLLLKPEGLTRHKSTLIRAPTENGAATMDTLTPRGLTSSQSQVSYCTLLILCFV